MVKEDIHSLISQKEAAEIRGVSLAAIADLIKRERLQPIEIGGRKFLRRGDVLRFKPSKGGRPPFDRRASVLAKRKPQRADDKTFLKRKRA